MRAHSARKPRALLRGKKVLDFHSGEQLFQKDSTTRTQYGNFVSKVMFDTLTDKQRQEQIDGVMNNLGKNTNFNAQGT